MKQRLLPLMAAVSLLLCAATIAGWVRSHWVGDAVYFTWHTRSNGIITEVRLGVLHNDGDVDFNFSEDTPAVHVTPEHYWEYANGPPWQLHKFLDSLNGRPLSFMGYGWYSHNSAPPPGATGSTQIDSDIVLPYWLLTLLTALAPAWWLLFSRHRRAARRIQQGLCPTCGYDLRATPARCPECGTVPATSIVPEHSA